MKTQLANVIVGKIWKERMRQITQEGFTPEHDDKHSNEELASAAVFYAAPEKYGEMFAFWQFAGPPPNRARVQRIRQLVIAAALIVAEIERLERLDK